MDQEESTKWLMLYDYIASADPSDSVLNVDDINRDFGIYFDELCRGSSERNIVEPVGDKTEAIERSMEKTGEYGSKSIESESGELEGELSRSQKRTRRRKLCRMSKNKINRKTEDMNMTIVDMEEDTTNEIENEVREDSTKVLEDDILNSSQVSNDDVLSNSLVESDSRERELLSRSQRKTRRRKLCRMGQNTVNQKNMQKVMEQDMFVTIADMKDNTTNKREKEISEDNTKVSEEETSNRDARNSLVESEPKKLEDPSRKERKTTWTKLCRMAQHDISVETALKRATGQDAKEIPINISEKKMSEDSTKLSPSNKTSSSQTNLNVLPNSSIESGSRKVEYLSKCQKKRMRRKLYRMNQSNLIPETTATIVDVKKDTTNKRDKEVSEENTEVLGCTSSVESESKKLIGISKRVMKQDMSIPIVDENENATSEREKEISEDNTKVSKDDKPDSSQTSSSIESKSQELEEPSRNERKTTLTKLCRMGQHEISVETTSKKVMEQDAKEITTNKSQEKESGVSAKVPASNARSSSQTSSHVLRTSSVKDGSREMENLSKCQKKRIRKKLYRMSQDYLIPETTAQKVIEQDMRIRVLDVKKNTNNEKEKEISEDNTEVLECTSSVESKSRKLEELSKRVVNQDMSITIVDENENTTNERDKEISKDIVETLAAHELNSQASNTLKKDYIVIIIEDDDDNKEEKELNEDKTEDDDVIYLQTSKSLEEALKITVAGAENGVKAEGEGNIKSPKMINKENEISEDNTQVLECTSSFENKSRKLEELSKRVVNQDISITIVDENENAVNEKEKEICEDSADKPADNELNSRVSNTLKKDYIIIIIEDDMDNEDEKELKEDKTEDDDVIYLQTSKSLEEELEITVTDTENGIKSEGGGNIESPKMICEETSDSQAKIENELECKEFIKSFPMPKDEESTKSATKFDEECGDLRPEGMDAKRSETEPEASTSFASPGTAKTETHLQAAPVCQLFSGGEAAHAVKRFTGLYTGPYFDPTTTTNITTQLGTHAYLPCKVKQLGNKSVSWIRRRDAHILTVDRYTFIADDRFQAFLVEATDTWTLQVKYVQPRDAGQYECQVSTEPKMSHFITLNVVVPKIEISGESDIYVKTGSTVSLKCVITQSLEEPAYIFWYHDGERVLKYDRNAIDIRTERVGTDTTVSTLIIFHARTEDSGNYTCSPSNLDSASVLLHVLNGEHPAAMQRGKNSASPIPAWSHLSMAIGLAACTPPRFAIGVALSLAVVGELFAT